MYDKDDELSMVDTEMRLYVQYIHDLVRLNQQMADATALINNGDTYGVSSPRIKSTEETKYQTSPKVYTEDAALTRMAKKELHIESLAALRIETSMKQNFCFRVQERICAANLTDKEMQILYLRYFRKMSLRDIAQKMWSNKDGVSKILRHVLVNVSHTELQEYDDE